MNNKIEFQPTHAILWFQSDEFEGRYNYIKVEVGQELEQTLCAYYNDHIDNLFDEVYFAKLIRIDYVDDSGDFKLSIITQKDSKIVLDI